MECLVGESGASANRRYLNPEQPSDGLPAARRTLFYLFQMQFEALTPTIGSRVVDFDVRQASAADVDQLRRQIAKKGVLLFPQQSLQIEEQEDFSEKFGQLWLGDFLKPVAGHRYAIPITNKGKQLAISERWHADSTYDQCPPNLSFLNAHDIPELGGDTMWCNQYLVYEYLPEGLKAMLRQVKAVHYNRGQVMVRTGQSRDDLPGFAHPLIIRHPVSGQPVLYLSAHAEHLEGLSREESAPLLNQLKSYLGQPAFTYRHRWTRGDLLIWDNRCTTHFAVHDYGDYPRYMTRVTTGGPQPEAFFAEDEIEVRV